MKRLSNVYLCKFIEIVQPFDNYTKRYKNDFEATEKSFEETLSLFKNFTEVASQYYLTKTNFYSQNKNTVRAKNTVHNVDLTEIEDNYFQANNPYEEILLETFRKVSPNAKRRTFHLIIDAIEKKNLGNKD